MVSKQAPLIMVAGSIEAGRTYDPPLVNPDGAKQAAMNIGGALALADCRLAVFSASPKFVEVNIVEGFVGQLKLKSKTLKKNRIEIRAPFGSPADFPGSPEHPEIYGMRTDQHQSWRHSFLRTLSEVDGVILIGGERSTLAIGILALAYKIPLVAMSAFGGATREVWKTIKPGADLPSAQETEEMSQSTVTLELASACVRGLLAQGQRRRDEASEAQRQVQRGRNRLSARAGIGAVILLFAIVLAWAASLVSPPNASVTLAMVLLGPLAGAATALSGSSLSENPSRAPIHTAALGFVSGFLTALIYLVAQMSSKNFQIEALTLWLALGTGAGAGFAAERVLRDWTSGKVKVTG